MEVSRAASITDELGRLSEAALADAGAAEAEACFDRLAAATDALEARTALRSAGAIAAAVRALDRSRGNARAQASGCRALARFAGADRRSRVCTCEAGAAKTARSAIERHAGYPSPSSPSPSPGPRPDPNPNPNPMTPGIRRTRGSASRRARCCAPWRPNPSPTPSPTPTLTPIILTPTRCALALQAGGHATPMAGDLGGTLELDVAEEDRAFFAAARRRQP